MWSLLGNTKLPSTAATVVVLAVVMLFWLQEPSGYFTSQCYGDHFWRTSMQRTKCLRDSSLSVFRNLFTSSGTMKEGLCDKIWFVFPRSKIRFYQVFTVKLRRLQRNKLLAKVNQEGNLVPTLSAKDCFNSGSVAIFLFICSKRSGHMELVNIMTIIDGVWIQVVDCHFGRLWCDSSGFREIAHIGHRGKDKCRHNPAN